MRGLFTGVGDLDSLDTMWGNVEVHFYGPYRTLWIKCTALVLGSSQILSGGRAVIYNQMFIFRCRLPCILLKLISTLHQALVYLKLFVCCYSANSWTVSCEG